MMKETLGIILVQERFNAMRELTMHRTIASVPFGGRYRLIDFTLSSLVNSGVREVGISTRSNFYSLMDHIGSGKIWDLNRKKGGLTVFPQSGSITGSLAGASKVETLYSMLDYIKRSRAKYVLVCDSNIVGNIDYNKLLEYHIEKHAYLTVAYQKDVFDPSRFHGNAFLETDENGRVIDVTIDQGIQLHSKMALGIYIIERELLEFLISQCMAHNKLDFERNILQEMADDLDIYGWCCDEYVEKVDSIETFHNANMALLDPDIRNDLFMGDKIYTKVRDEMPTQHGENAIVENSMIADGCIIEGTVENSIIFRSVKVGKGAVIRNSIIMQSSEIGEDAIVENCITDKNVVISNGMKIVGAPNYPLVIAKGSKI
ncbi:MAG: glucose-1-phosphate adenylyltransferase subunit GlgD [Clostridia bacterium]|nr:glucose-1-phosphate adenylyltransferase subunit GlgD [Clostridia bacterium]